MGRQARIKKQRREHREQVKCKMVEAYQKSDVASYLEREFNTQLCSWQKYIINKVWGFKRG